MPIAAADTPNTPKGSSARSKASLFNTALSFLCGGGGGGIDSPASPSAAAAGKDACRFKLSVFDSNSTAISSDWEMEQPPLLADAGMMPEAPASFGLSTSLVERKLAEAMQEQQEQQREQRRACCAAEGDEEGEDAAGPAPVSLCRCDTMLQGEPLETYVRRISSVSARPSHEPRPEQAPGKPQHDEQKKIQAAAGHGRASQPQFGGTGRMGGGVSPRVLAEGLLAASMEA